MKFSRFLSAACAACLTVAMAVPAGAANVTPIDAEEVQLSEYAGSTMKCQVVVGAADGNGEDTSYIVDIAVPEGATKAQADQLVMSAVQPAAKASARIGEVFDTIITNDNLPTIVAPTFWNIGTGTFEMKYETLVVMFYDPIFSTGTSELIAQVTNTTTGVKATQSGRTDIPLSAYVYIIPSRDGGNNITFKNGESVNVKASVDAGYMEASSCEVWATVTEYT